MPESLYIIVFAFVPRDFEIMAFLFIFKEGFEAQLKRKIEEEKLPAWFLGNREEWEDHCEKAGEIGEAKFNRMPQELGDFGESIREWARKEKDATKRIIKALHNGLGIPYEILMAD